jgi:putative spermidine/putrescine transport system substrate-binding protein
VIFWRIVTMIFSRALPLVLALLGSAAAAPEEGALIIGTWGGSYEAAQREILFAPFEREGNGAIATVPYSGGLDILRGEDPPDLVDMSMSEAMAACADGLLQPLQGLELPPGVDGTPASDDFLPGSRTRCAITHTIFATVIAYNRQAFGSVRPRRLQHLFDLEEFPGPRALQATPGANLEWALRSLGVPRAELYSVLSTRRGLDLALDQLDTLSGSIRWWRDGDEPVRMLETGEVVMASGFNGRFFNARLDRGSPIEILWDGQLQERQTWVIPRGAARPERARQFIRYATATEPLIALAERMAYGPARRSALRLVGRHPEAGLDMSIQLPTHPYNAETAIKKDAQWYAQTYHRVRERFETWRRRNSVRQTMGTDSMEHSQ